MVRLLRLSAVFSLIAVILVFASPLAEGPATAMRSQQAALMISLVLLTVATALVRVPCAIMLLETDVLTPCTANGAAYHPVQPSLPLTC